MRFETFGHACLKVTQGDTGLIMDPWIVGSCYWRSWWHFPAIDTPVDDIVRGVRFIYLTHEHWDHCHYPSLRRFPRDTTILLARTTVPRMRDNAEGLGFKNIVELPHGRPLRLAPDLEVTSYQFGVVNDSALVVGNGRTTLLNLNDSKMRGAPLRWILRRHGPIDFLFQSHSNASGYPYCYTSEDAAEVRVRDRSDYIEEFAYVGSTIRPRYAIPFASNHCYLHKDTIEFNSLIVSPIEVQEHYNTCKIPDSSCVVMTSGDSWDESSGFSLGEHRELLDRESTIELYRQRHAATLEKVYAQEAKATLSFGSFERYFRRIIRAIPRVVRRLFAGIYVFEVPTDEKPFWVLDYGRGTIERHAIEPARYHVLYRIPVALLKDCVVRDMWATFAPGKRYRAHLRKGGLRYRYFFFVTLDLIANGFLPLKNNLTPRALRVLFARRREFYLYAGLIVRMMFWRRSGNRLRALYPRKLAGQRGGTDRV
ncbi:MAG: MBL fold metallo-hydrolase [Deltaproteobacteria bacterium]|nr:MBL fold metallo-hydrolase [Deltaproteobacteria bacterium]